jgi:hypothetical protein
MDNPFKGEKENEIFQQKRIIVSRLPFFVRMRSPADEPAPV